MKKYNKLREKDKKIQRNLIKNKLKLNLSLNKYKKQTN